jgi:hypothetical protein
MHKVFLTKIFETFWKLELYLFAGAGFCKQITGEENSIIINTVQLFSL